MTNVEHRSRSWIRPIERLDRNSWGDVHDDAVRFTLTAPVGVDMLARHLTLPPWALTGGSLQIETARRSRARDIRPTLRSPVRSAWLSAMAAPEGSIYPRCLPGEPRPGAVEVRGNWHGVAVAAAWRRAVRVLRRGPRAGQSRPGACRPWSPGLSGTGSGRSAGSSRRCR